MFVFYSIIIGIPVLLWLGVAYLALRQDKIGTDLKTRFMDMSTSQKVTPMILLLFVISSYGLATQGYHYTFIKKTGSAVLVLLIAVALSLLTHGMKLGLRMTVATIVLSLPALGVSLLFWALMENGYETLRSPDQRTNIVIEHRSFTLGETNHFYTFYKKVPFLPVMKDLKQDANIMTRNIVLQDNIKILGADKPEWYDGYLVFEAATGETFTVEWEKQQALIIGSYSEPIPGA